MEVVGGKEDEDPAGDPEEQRRCRRLTSAPSVSSIEVVTVEDASDDDSETSVSADGASREQLRSFSQLIDADLQEHASSSGALPIGDRWEEDEPSSVIVTLSKIVEPRIMARPRSSSGPLHMLLLETPLQ
ncbi:hypothetical protein GUJ93_ZPchr0004g40376 [Zizania palustris]|uniref:Uncharacterized protein n=1 Tax=Zizania palustris TaxID=103762 RepID=A0A8J5SM64_ZIZPA|nr:hypothetical protein GUJ93_ZPchr0004g40376 [Zizania palustris]